MTLPASRASEKSIFFTEPVVAPLQKMVTFVVLRRVEKPIAHEYLSVERRIDISATEIRNRVASGAPIRYLVPPIVEEMIRTRHTYLEVSK